MGTALTKLIYRGVYCLQCRVMENNRRVEGSYTKEGFGFEQ